MNAIKSIKLLNNTQNIRNNQENYLKGSQLLEKAFWRISYDDILISLSLKFRAVFIKKFLAIILRIRNRNSKEKLKKCIKRWKCLRPISITKNMEEIKTKLRLIVLRYDNNRIKQLSKHFNKWKFKKNRPSFKNEAEMHNAFCNLLNKWSNKNLIKNKKELIDNLSIDYINKQGQKFSKLKLRKLFKKYVFKKIKESFRPLIMKLKIEKLIISTIETKKTKKNNFLISIIRKWRFITFVNNMAKKKLELMYKNLHVSYMEMADEVLNSPDAVTSKELKHLFDLGYENKMKIISQTDTFFIKELGFDSETTFNKSFEGMLGFETMSNMSFKNKTATGFYDLKIKDKMKNNNNNSINSNKNINDEEANSFNNTLINSINIDAD
jgi:hypothetical protein